MADNWLIITIIALVTIGLCILVVCLIRRHLRQTGIKGTNPQSSTKPGDPIKHLNVELDPNTEIINVAKLLKNHKAKRILLQITPVLAFSLVGLSASWAIIQSYATTLSGGLADLTCTSTSTSSCMKFLNGTEDNPLQINLVRSSLIGTGTITLTAQTEVLLQNVTNVTGSMDLQAHLAEETSNKITNIKLNNSPNLTTGTPLVSTLRSDPGVTAQDGNIEVSLIVDKSIADGEYLIKIATTLVPDTLQTFDKTNPVYSSITPVNGASTTTAWDNATITLPDERDNKLYKIRKFTTHADNPSAPDTTTAWWWMIDNLAFALDNPSAPTYSPAAEHIEGGGMVDYTNTKAQYVTTGGGLTAEMGYLYNWCAATADTSTACGDSSSADSNVAMPNSICPAGTDSPWKLPKSNSTANLNDFAWLNGLMNGGTAADTDGDLYANWLPTGVWQGIFSGVYTDELYGQGYYGSYWSSTAYDTGLAYYLYFFDGGVLPGDGDFKHGGRAVRCVI